MEIMIRPKDLQMCPGGGWVRPAPCNHSARIFSTAPHSLPLPPAGVSLPRLQRKAAAGVDKPISKGLFSSALLALLTGIGASFLLMAMVWLLTADAMAETTPAAHSGAVHVRTASGLLIRNVPRLDTRVRIAVTGLLARVRVQQRFRNPSPEWVEARYVFPLPDDSAVDHMRMRIGERVIEGEIQEKAQARRNYERARQAGKQASLLEQQRPNIFSSSVANVPPGEEIRIEIEYQQAVQIRDGDFSLRFPMVVGPRYIPGAAVSTPLVGDHRQRFDGHGWARPTAQVPDAAHITPPVLAGGQSYQNPVRLEVLLDTGIALARLESPYHAIEVEQLGEGQRRIQLSQGEVPADRDFVLQWRLMLDGLPQAALFSEQWRDRHYSLLMVMPPAPEAVDTAGPRARELILVVDTSGSMHGDSMRQARHALRLALARLRPQDSFNLIRFNHRFESLYPASVPADRGHIQKALAFVDDLQADGGTEMEPAMRHALQRRKPGQRLRQVVFLTDGNIGNEAVLFETIRHNLGDSRLFPVGIGSAPNSHFMTRAARFGRGSYTFIGNSAEVGEKMQGLFERLAAPVLTDIRLTWTGSGGQPLEACDREGVAPPTDVYAGEPMWLVHCADQPIKALTIEGRLGEGSWRRSVQLQGGANASGVHVLWARQRIADWMARRSLGEQAQQARAEIVRIGLQHHLVSAYTSLVAVDKTPARVLQEILHARPVPTHLPKGWSSKQVFSVLPQTATSAPLQMLLGLAVVLLAWGGYRRQRA